MKKAKLILTIVILILLVIGFFWLRGVVKASHLTLEADQEIDMTPTQIQSIKAIGEWEFLSVSAEELVDTVRKGFIRNDELARIYYGTLRLGVNIRQVPADWIESRGDTIIMTLPKVKLLDKDFIDEARTKPFYESGTWRPADHEILYKVVLPQGGGVIVFCVVLMGRIAYFAIDFHIITLVVFRCRQGCRRQRTGCGRLRRQRRVRPGIRPGRPVRQDPASGQREF